jgi:hypothetical protein
MLPINFLRLLLLLGIIAPITGCMKSIEVNQYLLDLNNGVCLERRYEYATDYVGQRSEFKVVDPKKCSILIGHSPQEYKKVNRILNDLL